MAWPGVASVIQAGGSGDISLALDTNDWVLGYMVSNVGDDNGLNEALIQVTRQLPGTMTRQAHRAPLCSHLLRRTPAERQWRVPLRRPRRRGPGCRDAGLAVPHGPDGRLVHRDGHQPAGENGLAHDAGAVRLRR